MKNGIKNGKGFTLLEALIATVITVIIVATVVGVFKSSSEANRRIQARANVQQDARGALAIINRDLSQAAAGIPPAGIPVPQKAVFACDGVVCYLGGITYPNSVMSPVTPDGPIGANGTDAITIVYLDATWPITNKQLTGVGPKGANITVDTGTYDSTGIATPPPVGRNYLDPVVGTKVGDVLLLQNNNGGVAVTVTGVGAGGLLTLGVNDPLLLNKPGLAALEIGGIFLPASAARINVVTYFITNTPPASPNGVPVLMRQVSGHPAVPVAENAQNLLFTYDIFNPAVGPNGTYITAVPVNQINDASQIRKITMSLTLQSPTPDPGGNFHTLTVNSAISPRDLSFSNRFN